jgi:hypothetical protein
MRMIRRVVRVVLAIVILSGNEKSAFLRLPRHFGQTADSSLRSE